MTLDRKDLDELSIRFTYHRPHGTQNARYIELREAARALAMQITEMCPESRERALAVTKLEESIFWANASIARREEDPEWDRTKAGGL